MVRNDSWTASSAAAEDAVQESFLTIWRTSMRFDPELGSVRTWILSIVHRRTIDALRRNMVHLRRRSDAPVPDQPDPERTEDQVVGREQAEEVRAALAELPPAQRRVLDLAYFGGYTHREIARLLGEPLGTVKGRMRLGLERLKRRLAGEMA